MIILFNPEKLKEDFPIFKRKVNGRPLVFLDSASTSQKPYQVIEAEKEFYENYNANVHRSIYKISAEATEKYESAREKIQKLIGAEDYHIIFTRSCTESINFVAGGWAAKNMRKGDVILSSVMEHHSNIVPWQNLTRNGISIKFLDVNDDGELKLNGLDKNAKLISITHMSNVLGTINNVSELAKIANENGSLLMLDGAQSVPHMKINLGEIGCDFLAFSGHKMLGPTGTGILAVRKGVAENMNPILFGSDMIKEVTLGGTTFAEAPMKFETGTPNIAGFVGLSAAVDYLSKVGMDNIERHERELTQYAIEKLSDISGIKIYGPQSNRGGIISFNLGDAHSHDVATIMDEIGVAIRSGHHCAQPLMKRLGITATARASFYLYNTKSDIDILVEGLEKSREVLKL